MLVYISFQPMQVDNQLFAAKMSDDVGAVRLHNQLVENANQIWTSFTIKTSGSIIESSGTKGTVSIEAEYLTDLDAVVKQYELAIAQPLQVGIGMKLSEAVQALDFLGKKGRKGLFLWDPQVIAEETVEKAETLKQNKGPNAGFEGHHTGQKRLTTDNRPRSEITAISKEIRQAKELSQAAPKNDNSSSSLETSFHAKAKSQGDKDKKEATKKASSTDKLKTQLVQVLQQIKDQTDQLVQIKETNPDIYQSLMSLVQSVISLGREVFGETPTDIQKAEDLIGDLYKAISTIKPGVKLDQNPYLPVGALHVSPFHGDPEWERFHQSYDYSHLLPDKAKAEGMSMVVHHHGYTHDNGDIGREKIDTVLYDKNKVNVGKVDGFVRGRENAVKPTLQGGMKPDVSRSGKPAIEPHSLLHPEHRGKGLGTAMYEAAFSHAKNHLKINRVEGGDHSADADALHKRLSEKHGFSYKSKKQPVNPKDVAAGVVDNYPFSPYSYTIKDEDNFTPNEDLLFGKGHGVVFVRDGLKKAEDLEKRIAEIPMGKPMPNDKKVEWGDKPKPDSQTYDYSHTIPGKTRAEGYSINVNHGKHGNLQYFTARAFDKAGKNIGYVHAFNNKPGSIEPHSFIDKGHKGKGLGVALYESLYAHAKTNGINKIKGGEHSADAARVHESLARRHGMDYNKKPNPEYGETTLAEHAPYQYALKGELNPDAIEDDVLDKSGANPLGLAPVRVKGMPPGTLDNGKMKMTRSDGSIHWLSMRRGVTTNVNSETPLLGANTNPVSVQSKDSKVKEPGK